MDAQNVNLQKILAILAQPKKELEPLKDIEERRLDIKYIKRDGSIDKRPIRIYLPKNTVRPMPLVYVGHYEMPLDSLEIRDYLLNGYAVVSCADFKNDYNAVLTTDDLVFNNATLYTLRNMPEFDRNRIAVVGGSAGGYMSLMLNALQLGICCSVANGPICNLYFNFYKYFNETKKYNAEAMKKAFANGLKEPIALLSELPIPFLGMIAFSGGFVEGVNYIDDKENMSKWEAISPTAFTECFCNPLYINQATSDILVPIDQLTRKYTYAKGGDTLPTDFNSRMPYDIKRKLGLPLCERLDQSELNLFKIEPITDGSDTPLIFDKSKRFNVCVCDEGAPESYASHNIGVSTGRLTDIGYISYMFDLTAAKTNILTPEKILLFAERFSGKAFQLPAHEGVDDTVYGSLAVYRKEIIDELKKWTNDNGKSELLAIAGKAILLDETQKSAIELMLREV